MSTQPKPVAVLISDIHYNSNTLPIADAALRMAIRHANQLRIPIVVAGDLHDTKALLRGECVNAMIETFQTCKTKSFVLTGNHDLINERSQEHSLEFLRAHVDFLIDYTTKSPLLESYLIPYISNPEDLLQHLKTIPEGSRIIMHQGLQTAFMGHYVQDKTSLPKEAFADFRVIGGHYHARQDIKCGRLRKGAVGLFSYIGNPYTLTFGEANDPEKGFQILMDDGLLEFVPTNLRKHVVIECDWDDLDRARGQAAPDDLVWLKVKGPQSELSKLKKRNIGEALLGHSNFKLDLIPDGPSLEDVGTIHTRTDQEVLDALIDRLGEDQGRKEYLKMLWREIL